jgi:hypothetical protein
MQKFLNLTLPLRQDFDSIAGLKNLIDGIDSKKIEQALTEAETVHFARILLIGTQYIQIITTFDGDEEKYTEFFWEKLNLLFKNTYEFVEGAPTGDDWTLGNFKAFNDLRKHKPVPFFLYSAYPDKEVKDINNLA